MKTPSFLLLPIFLAAVPALADPPVAVPPRCDTPWLLEALPAFAGGGLPSSDPKGYVREVVEGATKNYILKFGYSSLCDNAAWRQLFRELPSTTPNPAVIEGLKFHTEGGVSTAYTAGRVSQAKLILVVSDFYALVDAKAMRAVAAADAAMTEAVKLDLVEAKNGAGTIRETVGGASGGIFGGMVPVNYAAKANGRAQLPPAEVVPAYSALTDEQGKPGSKILEFRKEVMELTVLLDRLAKSEAAVEARFGAKVAGLNDMVSGAPGFTAADPTKAGNDDAFKAALASLAGAPATPALNDVTAHGLLDRVDLGLRNLLLVRNAELTAANAAAKARIGNKTFAQIGAAARLDATGAALPAGSLQKAVLDRLAESADYRELDGLYDAAVQRKDETWLKSAAGIQAKETLERIRADAMSATTGTTDKRGVTFTVAGKPRSLDSAAAMPDQVDSDAAYRHDTAGMIAGLILNGERKEGKLQALIASIKGEGQPGGTLPGNQKPDERQVAALVPPPDSAAIAAGAAGCKDPRDVWQNNQQIYARRQAAAEGELANNNQTERETLDASSAIIIATWKAECEQKKADALAIKKGYFEKETDAQIRRDAAMVIAEKWCKDNEAIAKKTNADALADFNARTTGQNAAGNPATVRARASSALVKDYTDKIAGSIAILKTEYTTAITETGLSADMKARIIKRQKALNELTGNDPELPTYAGRWFAAAWPEDIKKKEYLDSMVNCQKKTGLVDGALVNDKYRNPADPDEVDKYCEVGSDLKKYIERNEGKTTPKPAGQGK